MSAVKPSPNRLRWRCSEVADLKRQGLVSSRLTNWRCAKVYHCVVPDRPPSRSQPAQLFGDGSRLTSFTRERPAEHGHRPRPSLHRFVDQRLRILRPLHGIGAGRLTSPLTIGGFTQRETSVALYPNQFWRKDKPVEVLAKVFHHVIKPLGLAMYTSTSSPETFRSTMALPDIPAMPKAVQLRRRDLPLRNPDAGYDRGLRKEPPWWSATRGLNAHAGAPARTS